MYGGEFVVATLVSLFGKSCDSTHNTEMDILVLPRSLIFLDNSRTRPAPFFLVSYQCASDHNLGSVTRMHRRCVVQCSAENFQGSPVYHYTFPAPVSQNTVYFAQLKQLRLDVSESQRQSYSVTPSTRSYTQVVCIGLIPTHCTLLLTGKQILTPST